MSRRSPDRDRDRRDRDRDIYRDRYPSSATSSAYRPRQPIPARRDEDEPGQIRREWEVERDPRVPPSIGSSTLPRRPSPGPKSRSRGGSPVFNKGKEVTAALEGFSKTMHATLLSTSTHALATQHLRRMESFPHTTNGSSVSLVEAQSRLRAAEVDLGERMRDLHGTFDELMKRTLVRPPTNDRDRDRDRDREREWERERELTKAEVDQVRERMKILERKLEQPQSASTHKGKEKEHVESQGPDGKRSRARLLLEEMIKRLEVVEGLKDDLDNRCTDLEDLVSSKVSDEMEIVRVGNSRWRVVEELRDPDGVIRCLKRKRPLDRGEYMMEPEPPAVGRVGGGGEDIPPPPDGVPPPPPADGEVVAALQQRVEAMENDRSELAQLRKMVETLQSQSHANPVPDPPTDNKQDPALALMQQQVDSLKSEIATLKQERLVREKTLVDTMTADLKKYCSEVVMNQILTTVAKLATQPKTNPHPGASPTLNQNQILMPNNKTSPAIGASPRLPSIPQGAVLPSTAGTSGTGQSSAAVAAMPRRLSGGSTSVNQAASSSRPPSAGPSLPPQNGATGPGNAAPNADTNISTSPRASLSAPQAKVNQLLPQNAPPARPATTTPTTQASPTLKPDQPPRPSSTNNPPLQPPTRSPKHAPRGSPQQQHQQHHQYPQMPPTYPPPMYPPMHFPGYGPQPHPQPGFEWTSHQPRQEQNQNPLNRLMQAPPPDQPHAHPQPQSQFQAFGFPGLGPAPPPPPPGGGPGSLVQKMSNAMAQAQQVQGQGQPGGPGQVINGQWYPLGRP